MKKLAIQGKTKKQICDSLSYEMRIINHQCKKHKIIINGHKTDWNQESINQLIELNKQGFNDKIIGQKIGIRARHIYKKEKSWVLMPLEHGPSNKLIY